MMAPIGSLQTITPEGGVAVAKAAAEFGTMNFVSSVTQRAWKRSLRARTIQRSFSSTSVAVWIGVKKSLGA